MEDGRTIFNMKDGNSKRNLSQKLLIAFNESKYHLEHQFICLKCLGISVNPLCCKNCKYSYCANCNQLLLPASKIICICRKTSKQNFQFQINQELLNSYYCIQDKSSLKKSQISYSDSLNWQNESPYNFIPSENGDPTTFVIGRYNKNCQLTNLKVSRHQSNYLHPFSLKEARLINFNFANGYLLELKNKELCANDGNFLRAIHLAKIELKWCYWNIDFSFSLNKAIRSNKNKLKEIIVQNYKEGINLKSYLTILNALTFCSKLEIIKFELGHKYFKDKHIPKSFYEFLSNSYNLEEIEYFGYVFYDYMNYKPFQSLMSLQSLTFSRCIFNFNCFELMYQNNYPKMQKLFLWNNQITNSFSGEKIGTSNPLLHNFFKFPSILTLDLIDSSDSLENLLFEALIKSESIKLKHLRILFDDKWNFKPIPSFFNFLKVSNIQFLSINYLEFTKGFDSDEFCEFLRNTKFLQGLLLTDSKQDDYNAGLVLQALSFNKSVKVLYLQYMHLSTFYSDLINLILSNQVITILRLYYCHIQIDLNFINGLSKNKSVLYLDLYGNDINDDYAVKVSELNIKGINVGYALISKSNEEMIYKKIPKFDAPFYIYKCEEFMKEKKVN